MDHLFLITHLSALNTPSGYRGYSTSHDFHSAFVVLYVLYHLTVLVREAPSETTIAGDEAASGFSCASNSHPGFS